MPSIIIKVEKGDYLQAASIQKILGPWHTASLGPLHTQGWRPLTMAMQELSLVEKAETFQVHFTLGGEGPKAQRKVCGWKVYMESYMAGCGQEVGLVQIMETTSF